ncbi:T9SS type A sorting domain-containing protein [Kordia sp.]|uniref:T9SS type A sorting domain-containing protein n=1 Tax=Kordia sp. TaxID=1965332 RepID=UPI003B5B9319
MKKITLTIVLLFACLFGFANDTEAPTTPTNLRFPDNPLVQPDSISVLWDHSTDNIGVATYEVYINGILEEIVPYDGTDTFQFIPLLNYSNGTYCIRVLARDAAGNASSLSNEVCKTVSVIYQNEPNKLYISGLLNYSGDNKAIELSNLTYQPIDLSDYSIKVSYDGSGTWDTVYTFPANTILPVYETYVIAHPNISICTEFVNNYDASITNFDGNDVIGLFKYDVFYDAIGQLGNNATIINADMYMKRTYMTTIPTTAFDLNTWDTFSSNGNCPPDFGFASIAVLTVEEEAINSFQMYPNPVATNTLQFNTTNNQTIDTISILDINGRTLLNSSNINNNQLDIQTLKQGVYFVKVQVGNVISTHKLIRQ